MEKFWLTGKVAAANEISPQDLLEVLIHAKQRTYRITQAGTLPTKPMCMRDMTTLWQHGIYKTYAFTLHAHALGVTESAVHAAGLKKPEEKTRHIGPDSELSTKERNTLYRIIAALCSEHDYDLSKPTKTASRISALTELRGARVSPRAVEDHLRRIAAAKTAIA